MERDLAQVREQLAAVLEIHRAIARPMERGALFRAVAHALVRVSPARRVTLLLPGPDPTALRVYAADGKDGTRFVEGESIPCATSIPGWVVENRTPLIANRGDEMRERFPTSHERLTREGMESVAVLPLLVGGRCVGALSLMAERAGAWDAVPRDLLEEIATSVAMALDSVVTSEEAEHLRDERDALLEINRAVGRCLRRDDLFAALARCLEGLLPYDRFGIELPIAADRLRAHVLAPAHDGVVPAHIEELPAAGTACRWVEQNRQWIVASSRGELGERFPVTFEVMKREAMQSLCAVPLVADECCRGVLFFMAARQGVYRGLRRGLLEQVASAVGVALDHCLAYEELQALRDRLAAEKGYLEEEIRQDHNFEEIVGRSPALRRVLAELEQVAVTDSTVLICGETGTGKELVARAMHARSRRAGHALVKVNCAAIPTGLVESELFGHERGAFTGATERRIGRFELANGGTIFLDEVGELPPDMQVKLLRVLQEREFERVGGSRTIRVDVRVIAATNRDLPGEVEAGRFRRDLYYRLNVFPLSLPPLRDRPDDIELLAHYFLRRKARQVGREVMRISPDSLRRLRAYTWPGNVRELGNLIERGLIVGNGPVLEIGDDLLPGVGSGSASDPTAPVTLSDADRQHLRRVLDRCGWVVEGPRGAAAVLGLHPSTLRSRMKKLGLQRPD